MSKPVIGILTWRMGKRFEEPGYLRRLVQAGQKLDAVVYLFSQQDVFVQQRKIRGFVPKVGGGWEVKWFPWPNIVIDRYRKRVKEYLRLRHRKLFCYANSTFAKKWQITQLLGADERVKRWIPQTVAYSPTGLRQMLGHHPLLYIKPGNGTGGRSILKVAAQANGYQLQGRDRRMAKRNLHVKTAAAMESLVNSWVKENQIRDGNFMVQQGLHLSLVSDRVVDVRLLIQKDERGDWSVTGCGVRLGASGSSVSNLHGGGKAVAFETFMGKRFGSEKAGEILRECHELAHQTAVTLEERFGRMIEFGLDIGVDVEGRVWLIEVNPKPGREVFRQMGQLGTYAEAIRRPVLYALHLIRTGQTGRGQKTDTG
ncbi:YheC/YheD family protein [Brevibacillus sp. H7]|uniref:YheC/YheD family endospore coat-associated protein n=1 Tax=Brevibacillus sp. H7 TaxID=3349138 RepID=UPI0038093DC6